MTGLQTDGPSILEENVFLRREVLDRGLSDKTIRRMLRAGEWARVRHGAYCAGEVWRAAAEHERHLLRTRAALMTVGDVAVSHLSAAALHGLDLWDVDLSRVHLTRLDNGAGRVERDLVHHEGFWVDGDLTSVAGLAATSPVRATLETALLAGTERGLVVADSALRQGLCTPEQLLRQQKVMQRWPGAQHLQIVARLAAAGSQSPGESRARHLFWRMGVPSPVLQFEVYDGAELVGITDFAWPALGLLGEFDGRVKYGRYLRPGEQPGDAVFREKRREDRLRQVTGWGMLRMTWADLDQPRLVAQTFRALARRPGA